MNNVIPVQDPSYALWCRCRPEDLDLMADLLVAPPVPAGKIASRLGLTVISKTLNSNISGLIRFDGSKYIIEVNNTDADVRQRFTVSHEIAHYLLHRDLIDAEGIQDTILFRSNLSNRQEAEANRLAAAILLPWNAVNAWHQAAYGTAPSPENLEAIARQFRVSRLAVGFRFGF